MTVPSVVRQLEAARRLEAVPADRPTAGGVAVTLGGDVASAVPFAA